MFGDMCISIDEMADFINGAVCVENRLVLLHDDREWRWRSQRDGGNGAETMAITEEELKQANIRMPLVRESGHAVSARYDHRRSRIVVALNAGVELTFPTRLPEGLAGASAENLADIEVSPAGLGLRWPRLDANLHVPA
jgi:hypothetical protein